MNDNEIGDPTTSFPKNLWGVLVDLADAVINFVIIHKTKISLLTYDL